MLPKPTRVERRAAAAVRRAQRQAIKATAQRRARVEAAKVVARVRAVVKQRDGRCRLRAANLVVGSLNLPVEQWRRVSADHLQRCVGPSEWAHIGRHRRCHTRGQAASDRHTEAGTVMLCRGHHDRYDAHLFDLVPLDPGLGAAGYLRVEGVGLPEGLMV